MSETGSAKGRSWHRTRRISWGDLPAAPWINLSWGLSVLYILALVPIRGLGALPAVVGAAWILANVLLTVFGRAKLRRLLARSEERAARIIAGAEAPPSTPGASEAAPEGEGEKAEEEIVRGTSLLRDALRRLRRNQMATLSLGIVIVFALLCFGQRIWFAAERDAPAPSTFFALHVDHTRVNKDRPFEPPSKDHWFGTDALGRDLFARVLFGGSISFQVAIIGTLVSLVIGVLWGAVSGYYGGRVDQVLMRIVDVLYGLPFMFLVILIMSLVNGLHVRAGAAREHIETIRSLEEAGRLDEARSYALEYGVDAEARIAVFLDDHLSPMVAMFIALGLVQWLTMARITRGQVLSLREREFVLAARVAGAGTARIVLAHLIPNLLGPVVVYTTLTVPTIMLAEAFLSFLGLGISEPDCSWGSLAAEGVAGINVVKPYWWLLLYPSAALALTLFSLNFLGDGLRDALDPRER